MHRIACVFAHLDRSPRHTIHRRQYLPRVRAAVRGKHCKVDPRYLQPPPRQHRTYRTSQGRYAELDSRRDRDWRLVSRLSMSRVQGSGARVVKVVSAYWTVSPHVAAWHPRHTVARHVDQAQACGAGQSGGRFVGSRVRCGLAEEEGCGEVENARTFSCLGWLQCPPCVPPASIVHRRVSHAVTS